MSQARYLGKKKKRYDHPLVRSNQSIWTQLHAAVPCPCRRLQQIQELILKALYHKVHWAAFLFCIISSWWRRESLIALPITSDHFLSSWTSVHDRCQYLGNSVKFLRCSLEINKSSALKRADQSSIVSIATKLLRKLRVQAPSNTSHVWLGGDGLFNSERHNCRYI